MIPYLRGGTEGNLSGGRRKQQRSDGGGGSKRCMAFFRVGAVDLM